MIGRVSLVGAGPGDPELLTLKAVRRLSEAQFVLYDALVSPDALAYAPRARRLFVGKRAGCAAMPQEEIHRLMIRAARRGDRVVRLKGGDPFVFGRGGEEVLALADAGIPCEVIPGVTSAVAAPLLADIPVTHRGVSSAFLVVSGHSPASYRPVLTSLEPHSATVVVMMGVANRIEIAGGLLCAGWKPETPCAIVSAASRDEQHVWRGTLAQLTAAEPETDTNDAATIVIGDVVGVLAAARSLQQEDVNSRSSRSYVCSR